MGLLSAKWISSKEVTSNIILFLKDFFVTFPIEKATLNICGLGFYNFEVNNQIVPQPYFKPVASDYKKRKDPYFDGKNPNNYFAYFDSYDITNFIVSGNNSLKVSVAPGYFHNVDKSPSVYKDYDYGKSRLIFEILIETVGKKVITIQSDGSETYLITKNSSTVFYGDHFDFRSYKHLYQKVEILGEHIKLKPNKCPYDYLKEVFLPIPLKKEKTLHIYDFKNNHTGGLVFSVKGKAGSKLTIKYGEVINDDLTLDLSTSKFCNGTREHLIDVFQINTYILSGDVDSININFSYRCYRYVEISCDEPFEIYDLKSLFIHTDVNQRIHIDTSNDIINDIFNKYVQTQYCNMHNGFITDCPHREKAPYTGDTTVICQTLTTIFDAEELLSKFLDDIISCQLENGFVPYTTPDYACGGGLFWSHAIINVPLRLYNISKNKEYIQRALPAVEKFVNYLNSQHGGDYIIKQTNKNMWFLGDWLAPDPVISDTNFIVTCCFYLSVKSLIHFNDILNIETPLKTHQLLQNIKNSIISNFYNKNNHSFSKDVQGETVLGAYLDILEEDEKKLVNEHIRNIYTSNDYHIDTGIVVTSILFEYLAENDMKDIAYKIATQTTYPSYYSMLKDEATYSEHWSKKWVSYKVDDKGEKVVTESDDGLSHCHHMFGSVNYWVCKYVCGIGLEEYYKKVINLSPKYIDEVKRIHASIDSLDFEYNNQNTFIMNITVPSGYTVNIDLDSINSPLTINYNDSHLDKLQINNKFSLREGSYTIKLAKEKQYGK